MDNYCMAITTNKGPDTPYRRFTDPEAEPSLGRPSPFKLSRDGNEILIRAQNHQNKCLYVPACYRDHLSIGNYNPDTGVFQSMYQVGAAKDFENDDFAVAINGKNLRTETPDIIGADHL